MREAVEIKIDPVKVLGKFKDLRGVNCGTLSPSGWDKRITLDLTDKYLRLGIKIIRFHDLYPFDELDYIFPNPNADPTDPKNYNFAELDRHVEAAFKVADIVIFRIGYDWNEPPKNRPHLPLDKLANVVRHIVLHYTRGWANGYHHENILWEIWNEPDIDRFWAGTPEEYFELYNVLARAVKEANPNAKVGGPTLAYKLDFLDKFLDYVKSHSLPLDFISWHVYATDPRKVLRRANEVYGIIKKYEFENVLNVLDEWNYWVERGPWDVFREAKIASFQIAVLILLQDSPVDIAVLYRGDAWNWGGMFYKSGKPGKAFYAWLAYKQLLNTTRVRVSVNKENLFVAAGISKGKLLLLISNFADSDVEYVVNVKGYKVSQIFAVDEYHDFEQISFSSNSSQHIKIPPYAVHLVILKKE
ncbi:MAG: hypothetical protein DRZ82_06735 [Thermoprotei archaeon]|nr:MAG: hypothetical protein DRZ82_06735 [Thermoprotei archaeon]